MKIFALFLAVASIGSGCNGHKEMTAEERIPDQQQPNAAATRPVIVYRTQHDHRTHVPVQLSSVDGQVVSYPHPRDLRIENGLALPIELGNSYLLDERGIGTNVAFLNMDQETYSALEQAPSLRELDSLITDRDPLTELYDCGSPSDYGDLVQELKELVQNDALETRCKKLK